MKLKEFWRFCKGLSQKYSVFQKENWLSDQLGITGHRYWYHRARFQV